MRNERSWTSSGHLVVPGAEEQIEPDLPHRDRLRMAEQLGQRTELRGVRRCLLVRMPAAREVDAGVLLGDPPVAIRVLQVEPDGDDLVDAGGERALERPAEQPALLEQHQVTVGVDERRQVLAHRSAPITTVHSPRGGRAVNSSTSEAAVPRCNVSWSLVSSRATTTRPLAEDRRREPQRLGDAHRRLEECDGAVLAQRLLEDAQELARGARQEAEKAERARREAARCERRGERRRARDRRHAMAAVERGAHQDAPRDR